MTTGPNHPMGPGLNARVLDSDEHGSTQIVRDSSGTNWYLSILDGRIDYRRKLTLPVARHIARESCVVLGW